MAPLPPAGDVVRVQWKHTNAGNVDVMSRMYFAYTGSNPSATGLSSMASTIAGNWNTAMAPITGDPYTLTEIVIEDLSSLSGAVGTWTGSHAGTRGTQEMSLATATLVNFLLSRRYRGGKPRIYIPPGAGSDFTNEQQWSSTYVGLVQTAITAWIADIIAAGPSGTTISDQVNVSYYSGFTSVQNPVTKRYRNINTLRVTPEVDVIQSVSVNSKPANQRRRLGKR